jgi:hypothetical protein
MMDCEVVARTIGESIAATQLKSKVQATLLLQEIHKKELSEVCEPTATQF